MSRLLQEQITDETVELLQPYFAAPDFNYDSARKASGEDVVLLLPSSQDPVWSCMLINPISELLAIVSVSLPDCYVHYGKAIISFSSHYQLD